jgi:hypothetical protein
MGRKSHPPPRKASKEREARMVSEKDEVPISSLKVGSRFDLVLFSCDPPKRIPGILLSISPGSVTVKAEAGKQRTFSAVDKETGEMEEVVINSGAKTEHWDLETPVVPVEDVAVGL